MSRNYKALSIFVVSSLLASFSISLLPMEIIGKGALFSMILMANIAALLYFSKRIGNADGNIGAEAHNKEADLDEKLELLSELDEIFSSSLSGNDMFALISSRIGEIIPFSSCLLFTLSEDREDLLVLRAAGDRAKGFPGISHGCGLGLAGRALHSGKVEFDNTGSLDSGVLPFLLLKDTKSSICVALCHEGSPFGALGLYSKEENAYGEDSARLLETISNRISGAILRSMNQEKSLAHALRDPLTGLPNERAFYLLLEQQMAEAERLLDRKPVTILSIDIQNFDEINKKYGHIQGDNVLRFAAHLMKKQLRQMDALSRFVADEFYAVLPTASEETTNQIIQRLYYVFANTPCQLADDARITLELNFGSATFLRDGDTVDSLIKAAVKKKHLSKELYTSSNIINFPGQSMPDHQNPR